MKAQDAYLEQGINNEITAVVTKGMYKDDGQGNKVLRELSDGTLLTAERIKKLRENAKNELIKLTELTDKDGKYLFGLKTVKTALDLGTPQFVGVLQRNPSFQAILLNQIPQDKIQRLLDFRDTDVFDQAFGKGAAAFILSKYGG